MPQPRLRLLCLPHAGAGASSYFAWGAALVPAGIEVRAVQYPGRENRLAEPLITSARDLSATLANLWPALTEGGPVALFGHSMGALLAHELALQLVARGSPNPPLRLFLSGRNPPQVPPRLPPIHALPPGEFLRTVADRYGNLPAEVLADPEMLALVTPILRADFALVDTYRWEPRPPLTVPFTVLSGTDDPWTDPTALSGWQAHTSGPCHQRVIAGGHFFHQQARDAVIAAVRADLDLPEPEENR